MPVAIGVGNGERRTSDVKANKKMSLRTRTQSFLGCNPLEARDGIMGALEKSGEKVPETKDVPKEDHKTNGWRGSPRVWERCLLCDLRKECTKAGITRGSKQCMDARYALIRRNH